MAVARPSETARREEVREWWSRIVGMLVLAGWLVLARARRGLRRHGVAAAGSLAVIGLLLPPDNMLRSSELFSPGAFALPGPIELSLGRVLGVAAAGALGIGLLAGPARPPLPAWAVALAVTAFFPVLASVMHAGASPGFLAGAETGWVGFEVALALLPTLGAAVPLCVARAPEPRRRASWALVCALGLAALLSGAAAAVATVTGVPSWSAALWGVPAGLAALALGHWRGWRRELLGWVVAAVLGTTAALPLAWSGRIESRKTVAERQLERLGGRVDPYL